MTIPEISKAEGLTPSHVAKLLSILRRSGFVKSTRGQLGGYSLGRSPERVVIKDVLTALGGRVYEAGFCERHSGVLAECAHETDCVLRPLWSGVQEAIDGVTGRMTLSDLVSSHMAAPVTFHKDPKERVLTHDR